MMGGCFIFLLLLAGGSASICPAADLPLFRCSISTLFIIDATFHTESTENINIMFDYLESRILPKYGFLDNQNAVLATMGSKMDGFSRTSDYNTACHEAELLRQDALYNGLRNVTLTDSLKAIFNDFTTGYDAPVILFTANNDHDEIEAAGDYVRSEHSDAQFTIVSFNGSISDWRNFHFFGFYQTKFNQIFDKRRLDNCLLAYACRAVEDYCDAPYIPSNTTHVPYTLKPTYPNPIPSPFQCKCNVQQIWNDVIILMDVSYGEGITAVGYVWKYVQKSFSQFNILKNSATTEFFMKIGVVTYGDFAVVANSFGSLSGDDLQAMKTPAMSGTGAAVEKAVNLAIQQFKTKAARPNARKTIVIFGSDFTGDTEEMEKAKNTFLQMGGSFIIYDVRYSLNPILYDLASHVTTPNDVNGTLLQQAMCSENCYCPPNSVSYFSKDGFQTGGCYVPTSVSNKILSGKTCGQKQGFLAIDENGSKTEFIQKEFQAYSPAWIGLTYDISSNSYVWADNTTLSTSYAPWSDSYAMPPPANLNCVSLLNGTWVQTDCKHSLPGICEIPPCDSTRIC